MSFILIENFLGLVCYVLLSYIIYFLTNLSNFSFTLATDELSSADNIRQKKLTIKLQIFSAFFNSGSSLELFKHHMDRPCFHPTPILIQR